MNGCRDALVAACAVGVILLGYPQPPAGVSPGASDPSPSRSQGTRPSATVPLRTELPHPERQIIGTATWFRSPASVSAAGPALRAAVGAGWRGTRVRVCSAGGCVRTVLGDFCSCAGRLIDLDAPLFADLAPLSRGVLRVTVSW